LAAAEEHPLIPAASEQKPRLRGVTHEVGAYVALIAAVALVAAAPTPLSAWAGGIFGFSLVALLGISAAYHRPHWGPVARQRMRRLDHSAIFVLIAGTYTPFCLLVLPPSTGLPLLAVAWGGALLGVLQSNIWPSAPKALKAALYVGLGWIITTQWNTFGDLLNPSELYLLGAGGVTYTIGALVYALKRPNPVPGVFAYHEVFHALVIVAAGLNFAAIAPIVLASVG
jgi:hemolysin III